MSEYECVCVLVSVMCVCVLLSVMCVCVCLVCVLLSVMCVCVCVVSVSVCSGTEVTTAQRLKDKEMKIGGHRFVPCLGKKTCVRAGTCVCVCVCVRVCVCVCV